MRFDSSARTQHSVRRTLALEPRLIRFAVVKMGDKLKDIADVSGTAEEFAHIDPPRLLEEVEYERVLVQQRSQDQLLKQIQERRLRLKNTLGDRIAQGA